MTPDPYQTWQLAESVDVLATDGSSVKPLGELPGAASMARFELAAGAVSRAVSHATVQEIWHVVGGSGQLWRRQGEREEITPLRVGTTVSIPLGTTFQFRADQPGSAEGAAALVILAATVPAWPGTETEARLEVGRWQAENHDEDR
ncbi:cupin domain-containing protein [Kitasatospora kifunensis]|uniref:Mannose-6-phosphate isomerase-like protein (Cupin superfamily) n=1 Tax=Kitasatospora kifunensis TaxID=58351 RepID=A0A7W7VXC0_KITKI|nr:cupin domain-containing protein [Kitasatospora kifunensis]MBB4926442.1 mannose-6-phosphate isomerase-like protein (cupin superfamily) [Kitasatospora kifunensis]